MAVKKRGLGRGLDALLGQAARPVAESEAPVPAPELRAVPGETAARHPFRLRNSGPFPVRLQQNPML